MKIILILYVGYKRVVMTFTRTSRKNLVTMLGICTILFANEVEKEVVEVLHKSNESISH